MKKKTPKDKTITLCMIVKNETHIIKECLESMLPYIDRYDITDTGSEDGTPELIREFFDEYDIPGEVYLSDWKGFGDHDGNVGSRTEALKNCDKNADYAWMIDADDYISGEFNFPEKMDAESYSIRLGREEFTWWRNQIFKTKIGWSYVGVLHEYAALNPERQPDTGRIFGDYYICARTLGARNVGIDTVEKYSRDANVLEKALKKEPTNSRYQFYLAQSYFDSQQFEKSLEAYEKRSTMGGWEEEVFYSIYRSGMIKALLNRPWEEIQQAFLEAYNFRPIRAEPIYQIARIYRQIRNQPRLGYMFARMALEIPYPKEDILFVGDDIYKYQILDEVGATAFYAGKPHVGYAACKRLVEENLIPEHEKERVIANLAQYEEVMEKIHLHEAEMEAQHKHQQELENKNKKKQEKQLRKLKEKKSTKCNQKIKQKRKKK